jgi:hypothetical protein
MIYLFISDLIFQSRVENELRNLDLRGKFVKSADEANDAQKDSFAIFDLAESGGLIALKAFRQKFPEAKTLGFLPHVNEELKAQALQAGCARVIARFEFMKNLSQILRGEGL